MKIVIDAQSIVEKRTGVGRYVFRLSLSLGAFVKHQVTPLYFNFRRNFKDGKFWKAAGISPKEINWIPGFAPHLIWKYSEVMPVDFFTGPADIFHFPNYTIKPVRSGKTVLTVHDLAFRRFPNTLMPENLKTLRKQFEKSIKRASGIVTVSEFTRKEFLHFYPDYSKPVFVTYNGVDDFSRFTFLDAEAQSVRRKYNLPLHYLLHVGTLEPRKNLSKLLLAFNVLKKKVPEIKLILIGSRGWLCEEFDRIYNGLPLHVRNDIMFPGFFSGNDLPYLYALAKLFVFPSHYEGFGMPPLEALACGTPVLASDIPVMREVLGDQVDYCSPDATPSFWAERMESLLDQRWDRKALREKGKKYASLFSWEKTAEKTLEAYEQVLSR